MTEVRGLGAMKTMKRILTTLTLVAAMMVLLPQEFLRRRFAR